MESHENRRLLVSLRLSRTISNQRIAQCVLERLKPWFVVPPLIEPLAKNWLTDLLRAGRAYAARGFMKFDAGRFKLEAAEFKNSPYVAFEIIDDSFMVDS